MDLQLTKDELEDVWKQSTCMKEKEHHREVCASEKLKYEKKLAISLQCLANKFEGKDKRNNTTFQDLKEENDALMKLVVDVNYQRTYTRQLLLETDDKSQSLRKLHLAQQLMGLVRDFKATQLQTEIAPREAVLKSILHEAATIDQFQKGHAKEMYKVHTRIKQLRARLGVQYTQMGQMNKKLDCIGTHMATVCCTLCQIVEENDHCKWGSLIKDLYMIYAKEVRSTMKAEGFESEEQILHQRKTLERYVIVLEQSINRRNCEFNREATRYQTDHIRLLYECSESNKNVYNLAQLVKDLQGQVAYLKELAAKHREATSESLARLSKSLVSVNTTSSSSISQSGSKSQNGKQTSKKLQGENSPTICVKFDPDPELLENLRLKTMSTIPLSDIIKPYMHRGSTKKHLSMRRGSTKIIAEADKPEDLELLNTLERKKSEVKRKEEEIAHLQSHIYSVSAQPYFHPSSSSPSENLS